MNIRKVRSNEWSNLQELNNEVFIDNAKYDPDIVIDWAHSDMGKQYFQELVNECQKCLFCSRRQRQIGWIHCRCTQRYFLSEESLS